LPRAQHETAIRSSFSSYYIALGSIAELDTQYILAKELGFTVGSTTLESLITAVRKMTVGLIKHLKGK
jgi:four helix bundle protein